MGQMSFDECERMRGYASAAVDGELSEVESARLDAHVAVCGPCRGYAAGLRESARLIRQTQLESLDFPIVLPSRRLRLARTLQVAAAAATLAAAVGLTTMGGIGQTAHRSATVARSGPASSLRPEQELRMLRQASLRDRREHARFAR